LNSSFVKVSSFFALLSIIAFLVFGSSFVNQYSSCSYEVVMNDVFSVQGMLYGEIQFSVI
jgi:hypothetical protein